MSRRTASPPPPRPLRSPLDSDDLLGEILLRLPPLPSSLPRASCVCKRWRRLVVSDETGFRRRFRARHRDHPPFHGFFCYGGSNGCFFYPILERPDRLSPDRVVPMEKMLPGWEALGCCRGLILHKDREKLMVLDPIAGDQHPVRFPSSVDKTTFGFFLAMVVPAAADHDRRSSYRLVALFTDKATGKRVVAYVYSSESGIWGGDPVSTLILPSKAIHLGRPGTIVGNVIHCFLYGYKVLTFDLEMQILDFITLPPEVKKNFKDSNYEFRSQIIPLPAGDCDGDIQQLGLAVVAEPNMQFWERKKAGGDGNGAATWVLSRTVQLNFPPPASRRSNLKYEILGFDDESNAIFLLVHCALFMVYLKSMQIRKVLDQWAPVDIFPCSSF